MPGALPAEPSLRRDAAGVAVVFAVSAALLVLVLRGALADMDEASWQRVRLPLSLEDAQDVGLVLTEFTETHYWQVLGAHGAAYLFLQTFAIPGTVFVNLLGGALFGMTVGFPLCLVYNTIGSVFLYALSHFFGRRVVTTRFADKLAALKARIDPHRGELAQYMIFLRIFPFTPNWFLNIACAQLDVAVWKFAVGVFVGLTPYNFFSCKAGLILAQLRSRSEIIDTWTTVQLVLVSVGGVVLQRYYGGRFGPAASGGSGGSGGSRAVPKTPEKMKNV